MATLILLRHGQSVWNLENLFTGWVDVDLSDRGVDEAGRAGVQLAEADLRPDVLHTSLQKRAIRTAELALHACDRQWIPVRRSWRLNERHYGALQGKDKKQTADEFGIEQVKVWRRAYAVPPPPLALDDPGHPRFDPRYAGLPADVLPASECLADVVARMLPYWYDGIVPDLVAGHTTLVTAHGNSLRALVKHLDGISDDEIVDLNIPTGQPLVYDLAEDLTVTGRRYLDPEAAAAEAERVAKQAG
ncbi:MAG: phosphoglyceromutase [Actinomycetes bacterium]